MKTQQKALEAIVPMTSGIRLPDGFPNDTDIRNWIDSRRSRIGELALAKRVELNSVEPLWIEVQAMFLGMLRSKQAYGRDLWAAVEPLEYLVRGSRQLSAALSPDFFQVAAPSVNRIVERLATLGKELRPEHADELRASGTWRAPKTIPPGYLVSPEASSPTVPNGDLSPSSARFRAAFERVRNKFAEAFSMKWGTQEFDADEIAVLRLLAGEAGPDASVTCSVSLPACLNALRQNARTNPQYGNLSKQIEAAWQLQKHESSAVPLQRH